MALDINMVGPLANKRFFSTSTVGDESIEYILCNINSPTGSQLGIITFYGGLAGSLTQKAMLLPNLPYRFMTGPSILPGENCWATYIEDFWLKSVTGDNLTIEKDFINFYNPGMWVDGTSFKSNLNDMFIGFPHKIKFAEMNWSRVGLESINTAMYGGGKLMQLQYFPKAGETRKTGWITQLNRTKIRVHDTHASMVVVNYDNTYDHIYLGICSRVDLRPDTIRNEIYGNSVGSAQMDNSMYNNTTILYSIPTVIKLVVKRQDIISSQTNGSIKINPILNNTTDTRIASWTYAGVNDCLRQSCDRKFKTTINGGGYTNPETSLWNFNLIPSYTSLDPSDPNLVRSYFPSCPGATIDLDYDGVNSIICSATAGYWDTTNQYKVTHEVSKLDFGTPTGFFIDTGTYYSNKLDKLVKNQVICKESGNMYLTAIGLYPDVATTITAQPEVLLNVIPNDLNRDNVKTFLINNGLEYPDLVEKSGNLNFCGRIYNPSNTTTHGNGTIFNINNVSAFASVNFVGTYDGFLERMSSASYCTVLDGVPKALSALNVSSRRSCLASFSVNGTRYVPINKTIDINSLDRSFNVTNQENSTFILLYYGFQNNTLFHCFQKALNRSSISYFPWQDSTLEVNNFYSQDDFSGGLPSFTGYASFTLNPNLSTKGESYYTNPTYNQETTRVTMAGSSNSTSNVTSVNVRPDSFIINQNYIATFAPNQRLFGYDNSANGIPLTIHFTDCVGLESNLIIDSNAVVNIPMSDGTTKLGIAINTSKQPFIKPVDYYVDTTYFNSVDHGAGIRTSGYEVTGSPINVTFQYEGQNLLKNPDEPVNPHYYYYDKNGSFRFYIVLLLNLTSLNTGGQDFKNPSFILNNCYLELKFLNNTGIGGDQYWRQPHRVSITIDPPNGSGQIVPIGVRSAKKTINDITFELTRNNDLNSLDYTTIRNINEHRFLMSTKAESVIQKTIQSNESTKQFIIPNNTMKCGDCVYYTYEPLLGDVKPTGNLMPVTTSIVTNCAGHRYNLDKETLNLYIDSPSENLIDLIKDTEPSYIYLDLSVSNVPISVNADILCEQWVTAVADPRHSYTDEEIYPFMISGFIFASELSHSDALNDALMSSHQDIYRSNDSVRTYPNIKLNLTELNTYLSIQNSGTYWDYLYWDPNPYLPSELTSANLTIGDVIVRVPGKYRIYMGIVDEFEQVSMWCITNKAGNFKILGGN